MLRNKVSIIPLLFLLLVNGCFTPIGHHRSQSSQQTSADCTDPKNKDFQRITLSISVDSEWYVSLHEGRIRAITYSLANEGCTKLESEQRVCKYKLISGGNEIDSGMLDECPMSPVSQYLWPGEVASGFFFVGRLDEKYN